MKLRKLVNGSSPDFVQVDVVGRGGKIKDDDYNQKKNIFI